MSESVNFVLKSTSINKSDTPATYYEVAVINNIGKVDESRTSLTWNNISLRNVLGEMYDRYEKFNISLNFVGGSATGTNDETDANNRNFYVRMKGLNFTSSYNQGTGNNDNSVILTPLIIPVGAEKTWNHMYFTPTLFTFQKQDMVNINIDLLCLFNDDFYNPFDEDSMIGHIMFGFSITGIEDYKNNKKAENQNVDLQLRKIF